MYMCYTALGTLYLIVFGIEIGYDAVFMGDGEGWIETEPLEGHPIRFDITGRIFPVVRFF